MCDDVRPAEYARRVRGISLLVAGAFACGTGGGGDGGAPAARGQAGDIAIVGATVVPMDREGTLPRHTVLLRKGRIAALGPARSIDPGAATVVDGAGKWLVPALADMHVHLLEESDLQLFLLNGVTVVRDLFGSPRNLRWRDAIARGAMKGPTLILAGPIFDGAPPTWPGSAVVTTPQAARREVQAQKKAGYDWIKVYNGLGAEVYQAILDEAKAQGLPVGGHVPKSVGIEAVLRSGQRSIEHLDGYVPFFGEPHADDAIAAASAKAEVWNCATLIVTENFARLDQPEAMAGTRGLELMSAAVRSSWDPKNDFRARRFTPEMYEEARKRNQLRRALVGKLARAGGRLVLGTDTGNPYVVPGFAVHEELRLLVAAGLTPWQALRTATMAASELEGTPGAFGAVKPGARADLLLIDRDPLAGVDALVDPPIVIVRGVVHRHRELRDAIASSKKPSFADQLAALPALEVEGTQLASGRYQILLNGQEIGAERTVLSRAADKTRVVRGQVTFGSETFQYRATRDSLELEGADLPGPIRVAHQASGKAVATPKTGDPIELAAPADAIIAPQAVAEFVWYADILAPLAVGASRKVDTVEVVTDTGLRLDPARFTFTRKPDAGGRRTYDLTGTHGKLALAGSFTVDADGAPREITLTLTFGTFVIRRVDSP
jgi:imidazolonepropionase-like amidohydrolase